MTNNLDKVLSLAYNVSKKASDLEPYLFMAFIGTVVDVYCEANNMTEQDAEKMLEGLLDVSKDVHGVMGV